MTVVQSFSNVIAPERFDGLSWTQVQIQEAPASTGPWTTIDTLPWPEDPGDPDDLTTNNATLADGWYRVRWLDASNAASGWTDPYAAGSSPPQIVTGGKAVSVAQFAAYLGRPNLTGSSLTDVLAAQLIQSAEDLVESKIVYEISPTLAETRSLPVTHESAIRLPGGVSTLTAVTIGGQAYEPDNFRILRIRKRPYHLLLLPFQVTGTVEVTADWGFAVCPPGLVNAICSIAARDHFQRLNRQADITQSSDGSAASYFDRLPTVASQAIAEFSVPGV